MAENASDLPGIVGVIDAWARRLGAAYCAKPTLRHQHAVVFFDGQAVAGLQRPFALLLWRVISDPALSLFLAGTIGAI